MKSNFYLLAAAIITLASCSHKVTKVTKVITVTTPAGPYAQTDKVYSDHVAEYIAKIAQTNPAALTDSMGVPIPSQWVGTVNSGIRKANYVIIHYTAQDSLAQTIRTFITPVSQVSAHYVIGRDGRVIHMVNDYLRANHAGAGKWGNVVDMNSCSIGIEIDNNGSEPYSEVQIKSLLALLTFLKTTYNIPAANFIGHQDFAPRRKPDPGTYFPWKLLSQKGFGYWSDEVLELAPENFDVTTALRLIGYDTRDLNAAIIAFKRHFVQQDSSPKMSQLDLNVLYNVYQKY